MAVRRPAQKFVVAGDHNDKQQKATDPFNLHDFCTFRMPKNRISCYVNKKNKGSESEID
jgi:hypothetical protein